MTGVTSATLMSVSAGTVTGVTGISARPKDAVESAAIRFLNVPSEFLPRSDVSSEPTRSCTERMLVSWLMFHSMALRSIRTDGEALFV